MRPVLLASLLLLAPLPAAPQELAGHGGPVRALAVLAQPGTTTLASAGFDRSVILWDAAAGRARTVLRWHAGAVNALAALPDGGLASAGEDGRIALWPRGTAGPEPERVLAELGAPVAGLTASPDGRRLAAAAWDGTVRLWDLAPGGAPERVLEGHAGPVNGVAFRATDGALASAGYDGTLRLWPDGGNGTPRMLAELGLPQNALAALPDGTLAATGADGTIRLLAPDGTRREIAAGVRPIVALAASPDGALLAAAGLGGSATLWRLSEGRLLHTLGGPGQPFWSVAFAADGRTLWTGGADQRVRGWDVATGRATGTPVAAAAETSPAAPAAAVAAEPHGARVWRACAACHALGAAEPGAAAAAGPHLHGLFGRRMGSVPGYRYSARLARGDIVWTRETVADLFTRGPDVVTPGTKMPVQTVGAPEDLAALLRFLELATR
jgi:cytochrome c